MVRWENTAVMVSWEGADEKGQGLHAEMNFAMLHLLRKTAPKFISVLVIWSNVLKLKIGTK